MRWRIRELNKESDRHIAEALRLYADRLEVGDNSTTRAALRDDGNLRTQVIWRARKLAQKLFPVTDPPKKK